MNGSPHGRAFAFVALALTAFVGIGPSGAVARPSVADVDAAARAAGNRPKIARALGAALFQSSWPAQILKVRVDAAGAHVVAGLVLSAVKFHRPLDCADFEAEVVSVARLAFEQRSIEEVDIWAIVPIATHEHEIVSGDLAQPTSHIVFAATVLRSEGARFDARLRGGRDVYWDVAWRNSLATELKGATR